MLGGSPGWVGPRAAQPASGVAAVGRSGASGVVGLAVVCGAPRLAAGIGSRPGARVAGLWRQGASPACGPGAAEGVTSCGLRLARRWPGRAGASCCVARGDPRLLRVRLVPVLPLSVRRRLRAGEALSVCGGGLGVMSNRRLPSLCVSWRVSSRRLRTYRRSSSARSSQGWAFRG